MEVYFATNRNLRVSGDGSASPRDQGPKFGIHPADFRVGVATVDIVRRNTVHGERLDDTAIYRSAQLMREQRTQGRVTRRGSAELFRRVANVLAGNGDESTHAGRRSILVFIPGFNNSFEESITGGATIANLYSSDDHQLIPFVFSWPSDGEFGIYYYRSDQKDAESSGDAGKRVLESFFRYVNGINSPEQCSSSAFLFTHSMGAHVLRHAIKELLRDNCPAAPLFDATLLVAPDVDYDALEQPDKLLYVGKLTREVVVYANKKDKALTKATDLNSDVERMGLVGPTSRARKRLAVPLSTILCHKADNHANRDNSRHRYYRHSVAAVKDIKAVLSDKDQDEIENRKELSPGVYRLN